MKRVVGLGAFVVDTLISCDSFPREDTKRKAEKIVRAGGGPVCNALVVMSRLGTASEVVGAFADDEGGAFLLSDLNRYGVKAENAITIPNTTSFVSYVLLSASSGTRTCVFDRGNVPDAEENVRLSALDGAAVLHLDGNYLKSAIYAAKYAKAAGVKVSLDAGGLYEGIEELLPLVDILIPSAEFAMGITGKSTPREAILALNERYAPSVLAVTDGENGGYYIEDGKAVHYDSFKIDPIDTNGAGDTFHGAFISEYLCGGGIAECCRFASAVSAYKCIHSGVREFPLTRDIIHEFISKNG
ncbi:MAG: hypothetical protein J6Q69_06445 [Clostridia bacterium]|nr:hypothetical protein [Clostridia bacterium]